MPGYDGTGPNRQRNFRCRNMGMANPMNQPAGAGRGFGRFGNYQRSQPLPEQMADKIKILENELQELKAAYENSNNQR